MKTNKNNITMKKLIIISCFILLSPFTAKSQISVMDESYFLNRYIGITFGIGLTYYTGSVSFYADRVDCEPYSFSSKSGFETNFLFGLRTEWKISRHFDFCTSLLYEGRSANFEPLDYTLYVYVSDEKPFELASFNRRVDAKISILNITPMIKYRPFNFDFSILVGTSFAFVFSDELDVKESILEPVELFFQKIGGRERTIYLGKIESKNSFLFDLKFGLSCGIMLTEEIMLLPEIFYILPLTKINSEGDWKIFSTQFLVSLLYGF